jgi:CHAT domain-containing protein
VDRRTRPISWTSLALTLVLGLLAPACQNAMSIEEAKKVTTAFGGTSFVPPPRTINDIEALLDQQARTKPEVALRDRADAQPPNTTDRSALAEFYFQRGLAAAEIGVSRQEIDDLTKALEHWDPGGSLKNYEILYRLSMAELRGGSYSRHLEYRERAIDAATMNRDSAWLLWRHSTSTRRYADLGDLKAAEAALAELSTLYQQSFRWWSGSQPHYEANYAWAQAAVLDAKGEYAKAEALYRQAIAAVSGPRYARGTSPEELRDRLVQNLIRQERLLEAENEARKALLGMLAKRGRNSPQTASMLGLLGLAVFEQRRYQESERLARASVATYEKVGAPPGSLALALRRRDLASALSVQGRDQEALAESVTIVAGLSGEPGSLEKLVRRNLFFTEVLLRTGYADRALEPLGVALERSKQLLGEAHPNTAAIRGYMARVYAAQGDTSRALREFQEATRVLLARSPDVDEATRSRSREWGLVGTLISYISLLADIRGTPLEREAGIDATAEAFRLADVARSRSVQRALNASAARAAAGNPALADLVRREQDATKQINALNALLANLLSAPSDQPDPKAVLDLRARIDVLGRAHGALIAQIEKEFPAYAELINPRPVTVDEARAMLRPGETLIATLTTRRTFVWAVPSNGPVAFAAAPIGAGELERTVATLRKALEPRATTLGDIPDFDLALAYRLYRMLLEPVRSAWQDARSLLVVAHGPLGQVPLVLLPTRPVTLSAESGVTFANYRQVPWLVRSHAVTMLPSVSSLATLRTIPSGDPSRRSFVGFGDPYFSREQAAAAQEEATRAAATEGPSRSQSRPAELTALTTRGIPIAFRSSPQAFDSAQLAKLPRLPDTAEEIRGIARATNADPARDVFLGARANEKAVMTLDLARYRVVAFATHGLVPGDLDGLTQPALALSAPDVAGIDGDGLLTLDKILALRLNADWVVLSACNTASGQGAGAEAVSGLGRAFFYAGARALLVSHWPVETTSARALTTDLFRRQQEDPGVDRAQALQQTMNWLIDRGTFVDAVSGKPVFSYAHPIFWAPFTLIGDGSSNTATR